MFFKKYEPQPIMFCLFSRFWEFLCLKLKKRMCWNQVKFSIVFSLQIKWIDKSHVMHAEHMIIWVAEFVLLQIRPASFAIMLGTSSDTAEIRRGQRYKRDRSQELVTMNPRRLIVIEMKRDILVPAITSTATGREHQHQLHLLLKKNVEGVQPLIAHKFLKLKQQLRKENKMSLK